MKRLILLLAFVMTLLLLVGCGKAEFKDGTYTAFSGESGADYTFVTVVVEKGKVISYDIDVLQFRNGDYRVESKKELGDRYNMKNSSVIGKEWYEQAEAIETFFLGSGPENLPVDEDGYIDVSTGASVRDSNYSLTALAALELARKGETVELPEVVRDVLVRRGIIE
jgi:major membrane immunogen (membrane-anchored lipoprotein)